MAQRYGGRYSPDPNDDKAKPDPSSREDVFRSTPDQRKDGRNAFDGRRPKRAGGRANLLFFAPIPFLLTAFTGEPRDLTLGLSAFALMMLAAWLTREGIRAEEAYDARKVARRPAIPRKLFASVLTGAALFVGGLISQPDLIYPMIFGVIGAGLHLFSFGPDPLRDKGLEGVDQFQTDRVARAVEEAERHLAAMRDAILRAGDRGLEARVERFATIARAMFRGVEGDPGDLTAARKYLGIYLLGARDATMKFADLYAQNRDAGARSKYEALLTDLETNFASRTQGLLMNNRSDLDVEIDVLRELLERES